jgi:hypothetical protein
MLHKKIAASLTPASHENSKSKGSSMARDSVSMFQSSWHQCVVFLGPVKEVVTFDEGKVENMSAPGLQVLRGEDFKLHTRQLFK